MERAKLGDIEISVVSSEELSNKALVTEKPVEKGENVSDHTKKQPISINLTGAVVGDDAGDRLSKLVKLQKEGTLVKYVHRNALNNAVIEEINSVHNTKTKNGFTFNIRLKQIRIATAKEMEINIATPVSKNKAQSQTQVKPVTNSGLQQPKEKPVSLVRKETDKGIVTPVVGGTVNAIMSFWKPEQTKKGLYADGVF